MADFFKNGVIATLHDLGRRTTADLEQDLKAWSDDRPMSLVIPCLVSDLDGSALERILDELASVPYLEEVVVEADALDGLEGVECYSAEDYAPAERRLLCELDYRLSLPAAPAEPAEPAAKAPKACHAPPLAELKSVNA